MIYRIEYKGFTLVEADSEEKAKLKYDNSDILYNKETVLSIKDAHAMS